MAERVSGRRQQYSPSVGVLLLLDPDADIRQASQAAVAVLAVEPLSAAVRAEGEAAHWNAAYPGIAIVHMSRLLIASGRCLNGFFSPTLHLPLP